MAPLTSILTTVPMTMTGGGHGPGAMGGGFMGGFFPLFGWLLMLLVLGLVGYALVRAFRQPDGAQPAGQSDSALAVLRQRYARGEIDEEEFQSRRAQLDG